MKDHSPKRILAKLVYLLKRSLDDWIEVRLCCSDQLNFNKSQLPLFMTIGTVGVSNNELAASLNISKQAASKIIKELEAIDLVRSEKSVTDARSAMLYLTDRGIQLYNHIATQVDLLETEYKKLVGAKNYEIAMDVMLKLTEYHGQQCRICD